MSLLPVGIGSEEGGYQIERSLRFNSADSAYLNRTPASAGNRKTWTWSGWVKPTGVTNSGGENIFSTDNGTSATFGQLFFNGSTRILELNSYASAAYQWRLITTQVFRDPSAWYHIVAAVDTTQATSSNRIKIYVNGVQVTAFSTATYPTQNTDGAYNLNQAHYIGSSITNSGFLNGYQTECHFIDGSALDPTSFGEFNTDTGVWQPKAYTGSYGTNGFYLNFSDNSGTTSTTLGKDSSGNGNNWTPNNFSVTAGAGNDSLVDSPTRYGTDTGAGGEVRGNYATLNPLNRAANGTMSNGNLQVSDTNATAADTSTGTISMKSGKYYFEFTRTAADNSSYYGIIREDKYISGQAVGINSGDFGYNLETNGTLRLNGSSTSSWITAFSANDVCMVAYDADTGKVWFGRNGSWGGSGDPANGTNQAATVDSFATFGYLPWLRVIGSGGTETSVANFGQRPFAYTAPSGFKALVTTNLPEPTIKQGDDYFNAVLWTGDGTTPRSITGVGFAPDLTWLKQRSAPNNNWLCDTLREPALLSSNTTDGEANYLQIISALDSDGFTIGSNGQANGSGSTYVAWNWKANGAGVSNTAGTITSTVSVNTTSGFSIVTYTGTGANATVGHGLGVAPSMIIVKNRGATTDWAVYHKSLISAAYWLELNTTGAVSGPNAVVFNSTAPTSTVFSVGTNDRTNATSSYVAYCFAAVAGYSAFGSYTGNGSTDGPFVYTGFRPAFVITKCSSTTARSWSMKDSARSPFNLAQANLSANYSDAEGTTEGIDMLSNGFKIRQAGSDTNTSGQTYIFMAFAENPFSIALAR